MSHEINYDRRRALRALRRWPSRADPLEPVPGLRRLICRRRRRRWRRRRVGTTSGACVEAGSEPRGPCGLGDQTGMLNNQGFYRQDIREGRTGLALSLALTIVTSATTALRLANARSRKSRSGLYRCPRAAIPSTRSRGINCCRTEGRRFFAGCRRRICQRPRRRSRRDLSRLVSGPGHAHSRRCQRRRRARQVHTDRVSRRRDAAGVCQRHCARRDEIDQQRQRQRVFGRNVYGVGGVDRRSVAGGYTASLTIGISV